MARTVSTTKASTAKSTTPKQGTAAQLQRMNNTIKSLMKDGVGRGVIGTMYRKAMAMQGAGASGGRTVSDKDVNTSRRTVSDKDVKGKMYGGSAKAPKKMAKGGKLPMVKKGGKMVPAFAADGKGKMMYGGKTKKKK